jgi:hypothetical protein
LISAARATDITLLEINRCDIGYWEGLQCYGHTVPFNIGYKWGKSAFNSTMQINRDKGWVLALSIVVVMIYNDM